MMTFKDLGLSPMILQALEEIGFETPTEIQKETIPYILSEDNDLIALAQTGTGKTAAFALPIINQLSEQTNDVQSIILCPTRELAIQIASDIEKFLKYLNKVKVTPVYGGEDITKQMRALRRNPQIVVGTPGRVNDLIRRRVLKLHAIQWLVLDEADEMLNMGFKEELDDILKSTPETKQTLLFSATMNKPVRRIANDYMNKPKDITVGTKNSGADNVEHFYYMVHEKDRYQALRRIADMNSDIHGIVFCRTRIETQRVADKLIQDHYSAEAIHGDISQAQRTNVMNRFREKKIQLLVATDVAARGIDVNGLTHIINYNLPESTEGYVHRSGRTGRAHNKGISVIILNMREKYKLGSLEKRIGKKFEQGRIPSGDDICESQLFTLVDKVIGVDVNEAQIGKYMELINKKFEEMDREEIIKKFVSAEFNRFLEYYKNAVDLNSHVSKGGNDRNQRDKSSMLFARFKINVGRNLGLTVKELLQHLTSAPGLRSVEIGRIDIKNDSTTIEVDQKAEGKVMSCFTNADIVGVKVDIKCVETGVKSSRMSDGGAKRHGGGRSGGGRPPQRSGGYRSNSSNRRNSNSNSASNNKGGRSRKRF